jgi:hypothetical protein
LQDAGLRRWKVCADIVDAIDNVCSANGLLSAQHAFDRSLLSDYARSAHHHVQLRGVSTPLLHGAASAAFTTADWLPLLHYREGTLYAQMRAGRAVTPSRDDVKQQLVALLDVAIGKDVAKLVVGSPTANIMPKPDLIDHRETRQYLTAAANKIGRTSFARKTASDRRTVVTKYLTLKRGDAAIAQITQQEVEEQSRRISTAHPEMIVFKFFKALMRPEFIGENGLATLAREYDGVFGQNAWSDLRSTGNLKAAEDMSKCVDRYWTLPASQLGSYKGTVETLPDDVRTRSLVDVLTDIADKVYATNPNAPSRLQLAKTMAEAFISDLVQPTETGTDVRTLAKQQLAFYSQSKPDAGREARGASYLCPICNDPFQEGTKASADFIDKPESHTNRAVAHGRFGHVMICNACKFERILAQLLLGGKPAEVIVLFPRMNIGAGSGTHLVEAVQRFADDALQIMLGSTDPDDRLTLALTNIIAGHVGVHDHYTLSVDSLLSVLSYRSASDTSKQHRAQLRKLVLERWPTLGELNADWGTDYDSLEQALNDLVSGIAGDNDALLLRSRAYRLRPTFQLVCQSPNILLLPVTESFQIGKESETNAALRRLFIGLVLSLALDMTAGVLPYSDSLDLGEPDGVAFVPPVAGVRSLVGRNWIQLEDAEDWMKRIGVAAMLADATSYSERSNLAEVLRAPTAGHVLRRIESKQQSGMVTEMQMRLLRVLEGINQ